MESGKLQNSSSFYKAIISYFLSQLSSPLQTTSDVTESENAIHSHLKPDLKSSIISVSFTEDYNLEHPFPPHHVTRILGQNFNDGHLWLIWLSTILLLVIIVFGCSLQSKYLQDSCLISKAKQWMHLPVLHAVQDPLPLLEPGTTDSGPANDGIESGGESVVQHVDICWVSERNECEGKEMANQTAHMDTLSSDIDLSSQEIAHVMASVSLTETCPQELIPSSSNHSNERIEENLKSKEYPDVPLTKTGSLDEAVSRSDFREKCMKANKSVEEFSRPNSESTTSVPGTPLGKCRKLQERRGSSHSLTIAVKPAENTLPTVITPRECSAAQFLLTAGNCMTRRQLRACLKDVKSLHSEFWSIPTNVPDQIEQIAGSTLKNRYRYVLPNPHSRVKLPGDAVDPTIGYINGNYIRAYNGKPRTYIATQGPLTNTVNDFWLMVWTEKSPAIIMITKLVESGKAKCEPYIPERDCFYGDINVSVESMEEKEGYTVRHVVLKRDNDLHRVMHFWYSDWPDHKTPDNPRSLIDLAVAIESLRHGKKCLLSQTTSGDEAQENIGPIVVHCSAGVGRTGCFIALCQGLSQLIMEGKVDVLGIVCALRCDRGGMVQTAEQYEFIHRGLCLFERTLSDYTGD